MKEIIAVAMIEDSPDEAQVVRRLLVPRGDIPFQFRLSEASSLAGALALLAKGGIQLVLLDLYLPDAKGLDTYRKLQEAFPNLPVVVVTGLNDEAVALEAVRLGAQDYLVKGALSGTLLQRTLRYAFERARLSAGFEAAVRNAPDGTIVVGDEEKVLYMNPAAEAMFGQLLGQPFPHPAALEGVKEVRSRARGEERLIELRPGDIQWRSTPAKLVWARDVTDLKRMAQIEAEIRELRSAEAERRGDGG
jgi:DNA-binding NarL/FixJ family response regulator